MPALPKGVKAVTFYDVVLDFILMDAFEDLTAPPSSVLAVINNRWLSNGFKEGVRLRFTEASRTGAHFLRFPACSRHSPRPCGAC